MKEKIKNNLVIFFIFSALLLSAFNLAEARQGCCSHHGGVCGCGCCDGTSLSATCAPYYPSCSQSTADTKNDSPTWPYWVGGVALVSGFIWWANRKKK